MSLREEIDPTKYAPRFWSKVQKTDGCWLWVGATLSRDGNRSYGVLQLQKSPKIAILAHRLSWMIEHGSLRADDVVCHRCDNVQCVRPGHLFLGTQADNLADMRAKGRAFFNTFPEGVKHPNAKMNPERVREMRTLYATGSYSCERLAGEYDLNPSTVHDIVTRRTWRHVN